MAKQGPIPNRKCPKGGDGCSLIQKLEAEVAVDLGTVTSTVESAETRINNTLRELDQTVESAETRIEKKLEVVDSTVESAQTQIEKLKKAYSDIKSLQKEIDEHKDKDRQYTWARTFQIGLLTIAETLRIQDAVSFKPETAIGTADFDEYGIDKYFGMAYDNDIEYIMEIKEDCRDYDRLLVNDNKSLVEKVIKRLDIKPDRNGIKPDRNVVLERLRSDISKSPINIINPIFSHLDAIFIQVDRIDVVELEEKEVSEIKQIFSTYRGNITGIERKDLQKMLKFFGNIIHRIIERKIKLGKSL